MNVTVMDMMEARDRRAQRQRELLAEFGQTLLCFTMNIPGPEKLSPLIRAGFRLGCRMLERGFLRLGVTPAHADFFVAGTGISRADLNFDVLGSAFADYQIVFLLDV